MQGGVTVIAPPPVQNPNLRRGLCPGIFLLVLGVIMTILLIAMAASSGIASAWPYILNMISYLVTGSLAVHIIKEPSRGLGIGTVVMASLTLAWSVVAAIIYLVAVIGLAAARTSNSSEETAKNILLGVAIVVLIFAVIVAICSGVIISAACQTACQSDGTPGQVLVVNQPAQPAPAYAYDNPKAYP